MKKQAQQVVQSDEVQSIVDVHQEEVLTAKQERKRAYVTAISRILNESADVFKVDDLNKLHTKITKLRDRRWKKFQRKQEKQARKNHKENGDE